MRQITVPFGELGDRFRRYGAQARRNTYQNLLQVESRVKHIVTTETRYAPPASAKGGIGAVDTGNYLRGWQVTRAVIDGARGVLITNSAAYMAVIERGRRAGSTRPPIAVIAQWAQRKLGLPLEVAKKAAFPIANAIKRRGLYARRVMTGNPARNSYRNTMRELMGVALDEASIKVFS